MRGHAEQGTDGQHTRAAHTRNHDVISAAECGYRRVWQIGKNVIRFGRCVFTKLTTFNRHKRRAEPFQARIILVTARLVDLALAAIFGFQRHHRYTVRLGRTITAAFAHGTVDDDPLGRIRILATLPATAFFGGAGLVVNNNGGARCISAFIHHFGQPLTVQHIHARWNFRPVCIGPHIFSDDPCFLHALGHHLLCDTPDWQISVNRLAACHGDGVIVKNFISDIDLGRDRRANG